MYRSNRGHDFGFIYWLVGVLRVACDMIDETIKWMRMTKEKKIEMKTHNENERV